LPLTLTTGLQLRASGTPINFVFRHRLSGNELYLIRVLAEFYNTSQNDITNLYVIMTMNFLSVKNIIVAQSTP
jgi:hypothetical protein